ncbi:hypothetical protein PG999_014226 [Apiospora kogelbergensis]|uniref:Uncharacterized protein n=1 Tax=Apiospora kogelbergensis TaxID=1337665 RepID=A0AAW0Q6T0_9PEZI
MGRHSSHSSSHSSRSSSNNGACDTATPAAEAYYRDRREDDLVRRFNREARCSTQPTRYIVNDGSLVINESLLHDSNTLIYNRRGSSMWLLLRRVAVVSLRLSRPRVLQRWRGSRWAPSPRPRRQRLLLHHDENNDV